MSSMYSMSQKKNQQPSGFRRDNFDVSGKFSRKFDNKSNKTQTPVHKSKRICTTCTAKANLCDGSQNKEGNILHNISPRELLDGGFAAFIWKCLENGTILENPSPVFHKVPTEIHFIKKNAGGKLPCKYCVVGSCQRYSFDDSVQHIYNSFFPWSISDANKFLKLRKSKSDENKKSYQDTFHTRPNISPKEKYVNEQVIQDEKDKDDKDNDNDNKTSQTMQMIADYIKDSTRTPDEILMLKKMFNSFDNDKQKEVDPDKDQYQKKNNKKSQYQNRLDKIVHEHKDKLTPKVSFIHKANAL